MVILLDHERPNKKTLRGGFFHLINFRVIPNQPES